MQGLAYRVVSAWMTLGKAICPRASHLGQASTASAVPLRLRHAAGRSASMAASLGSSYLTTATRDAQISEGDHGGILGSDLPARLADNRSTATLFTLFAFLARIPRPGSISEGRRSKSEWQTE